MLVASPTFVLAALVPVPRMRHAPEAAALARHPPIRAFDMGVALYEAQLSADVLVSQNLASLTPLSALVLYGAGLLTSLTPCCLSMLPLTFAYIGGSVGDADERSASSMVPAVAFSGGLAVAFAALGTAAATFGSIFGSSGDGILLVLRTTVSLLAMCLGLNLLQLLPLSLPSFAAMNTEKMALPPYARAFLFGASSALVASPCASPVLASVLGYVASLGDPLLGASLLLCFTLGYTTPVLLTGVAATTARDLSSKLDGGLEWVSPISGSTLLAYGTYSALTTVFGAV